jgi:hypothetical protein
VLAGLTFVAKRNVASIDDDEKGEEK